MNAPDEQIHTGDDPRTDALTDLIEALNTIEEEASLQPAEGADVQDSLDDATEIRSALTSARAALEIIAPVVERFVRLSCLANSQPDEPVFVLAARDRFAASTVRKWAETVALMQGASEKTDSAYDLAAEMDVWRESHGGGKDPD